MIQVRFLAELPAALQRAAWDNLQCKTGHDGCAEALPSESVPVKIRRYMGRLPGGAAGAAQRECTPARKQRFDSALSLAQYLLRLMGHDGCIALLPSESVPVKIRRDAGMVQWKNVSFPNWRRGFDSRYRLHKKGGKP